MRYQTILVFCCMLVSSAWGTTEETAFKVGTRFPPYPQGCANDGGWMEGADASGAELAMSYTKCGAKTYLSLDRLTHHDEDEHNTPHWEVVDVVVLPDLKKGESIGEPFDCTYKTDGKAGVITVGTWRDTPKKTYASSISFAVRANDETLKIEKLNPKQVKCEYFEDRN